MISLNLPGYKTTVFPVIVKPGDVPIRKEVKLEKAFGFIKLKIRPTAIVSFSDQSKVLTPNTPAALDAPMLKPIEIQVGTHSVTIKNEELNVLRTLTITIKDGKTTIIDWEIKGNSDPEEYIEEDAGR